MADTPSATVAHVPAAPGTDLIIFDQVPEFVTDRCPESVEVSHYPIIAWRIFQDGTSVPLVAGLLSLEYTADAKYLGQPDGRIYDMRLEIYHADVDAAKASFLENVQTLWRRRHGSTEPVEGA